MKKTILTTFICSVIVVGVALSGIVVYNRFLKSDNQINNETNDLQNNKINKVYFNSNTLSEASYTLKYNDKTVIGYGDISKYSNIFEYFQDLESVSIKLDYATNEIKEENNYETVYHRDEYNLTSSEINDFFNDMKSTKQQFIGGFGGSSNVNYLYISYKINNKVHTTKIMIGMWLLEETTDGNIYKIMENNLPTKQDWNETVLQTADGSSNSLNNIIDILDNRLKHQ